MPATPDDLHQRLARVPLFAAWAEDDRRRLAAHAAFLDAAPGETILREGEFGDRMFLIERGSVQIFTRGFDGSDLVLARLEPGQWFGEQALLPGGSPRRNASARALDACRLVTLSRGDVAAALGRHPELLRRFQDAGAAERALREARIGEQLFAQLGVSSGSAAYELKTWPAGAVIFREGDPGDRAFLVLRGRAQASRREDGRDEVLSELLPGQFFGERAILQDAPRAASVQALEETETVSLDGTWFREACEQSPSLRALMDSLASMYLLPRRGVLALQTGSLDGRPSMTAVHSLPDGRRVVSTRLVGVAAFTSRRVGGGDPDETVRFDAAARGQFRELMLRERRLVGLHAEGEWPLLGEALGFLLDDVRLEAWQLALFRQRGEFRAEDPEPLYAESEELCACTHTTCGQIAQCLREGCHSVEEVAARTRATLVCGGCLPLVKELLGQADWTPARVVDSIPCTPEVRAFRLRPADAACREFRPGQHLVLQARIDNRWVQRAYTLTSAPGAEAYEITVKREPHGVFSRWLFDRLDSDSLLRLSPPNGAYTLPEDPARDVVCLVAGIGMTPALAFARSLERSPRAGRLHVDYSVSDEAQAVRAGELAQLHARHERLTFNLRVTGRVGRLGRREVHQLVEDYPEADFYLCGGEAYTESVRELLGLCGVPPERIKLEVFVDAGKPAPAAAAPGPAPAAAEAAPPPAHPREQARELLEAFYTEAGAREAFEARWPQVNGLFEFTGTYQQTAEELAYAARIAWRNSIRCIGRMYWRGLTVRDFRHVRSAEGMFEALFEHIELATNRGNLRPMMTVFAPLSVAGTGPRVWSPQLFRYAGYREADGRVLGDPANVELTEVARALGWEPPARRTPFDLLPLIVQAENDAPRWRAIPPELVLEVPIVHPQFAWFEDLQLKWYALPAVSCMRFDAGGVTYAAAPFNGWYMGTEIGARNFGDVARYNLLPVVAARMGLDTSNERTLWRDRALVELNAAVLHSYEKAGVTMMDHHAASHSFDKFEELERRAGRPVNAKWNWLVPPISGSAVTVFHKEGWPEVERIPNYFYQPDPWKTGSSWRRE